MGYRSEVALTMKNKDIHELIRRAKVECEPALDLIKNAAIHEHGKYITLHWDWIKWYEEFDDVGFIERFFKGKKEYCFRRLGEDNSDIEELCESNNWYVCEHTSTVREIVVNDTPSITERVIDKVTGNASNNQ